MDMKVDSFGIDLDTKDPVILAKSSKRAREYGKILIKESKNGYHIRVKLDKKMNVKQTFWLRLFCMDDERRLLYDLLRFVNGSNHIDILWDDKQLIKLYQLQQS